MKKALKLIFESNNFTLENEHYIQICGMSMGSPCAPSVWSLTFYSYEINFIKSHQKCLLWKRHIDDILLVFAGTERQLSTTIQKFIDNSPFSFTFSTKRDSVDFLDITVTFDKKMKMLNTQVYRHPAIIPV